MVLRAVTAAAEAQGGKGGGGAAGRGGGEGWGPMRAGASACLVARATPRCGPVTCL